MGLETLLSESDVLEIGLRELRRRLSSDLQVVKKVIEFRANDLDGTMSSYDAIFYYARSKKKEN